MNDILYQAEINIYAHDDIISFHAKGEALSSFKKNRIGICVFHPIRECSGRKVIITKPDGNIYHSQFPDSISPHQPFREIQKLNYTGNEGISAEFSFTGDIFETEDQRNWGDSTFKTYSTPLEIPIPVDVSKGANIEQSVEIRISGEKSKKHKAKTLEDEKITFPKIGYAATNADRLSRDEIGLLQQLPFDHYRVELFLFDNDWKKLLVQRLQEAIQLQTKLELVLWVDQDYSRQLVNFLDLTQANSTEIGSILILEQGHPTAQTTNYGSRLCDDKRKISANTGRLWY